MSIIESFGSTVATMGSGFSVDVLIGYALKKVIKIVAVIVGLFLAGLAYLQYHQVANINWNKFQHILEDANTTVINAIVHMPAFGHTSDQAASLTMTSFGIPLTGSTMSAGFTIGFMKG
jgi:uncharacterized membrane protein (Fun14 family)